MPSRTAGEEIADINERLEALKTQTPEQKQAEIQRLYQEARDVQNGTAPPEILDWKMTTATVLGEIGQFIPGKGIYAGLWRPQDRNCKNLDKTYALYAAPTDLTNASGEKLILTFNDAAKDVSRLRNWHGHDGVSISSPDKYDVALYNGLKDGSVVGKWFIPPRELLIESRFDKKEVFSEYLYKNRNDGAFKETFKADDYWSSTGTARCEYMANSVSFSNGDIKWDRLKDYGRCSIRPCRVEALSL